MPSLNKYPPVMAELLRRAGFKVDLQSMDWGHFGHAPYEELPRI